MYTFVYNKVNVESRSSGNWIALKCKINRVQQRQQIIPDPNKSISPKMVYKTVYLNKTTTKTFHKTIRALKISWQN